MGWSGGSQFSSTTFPVGVPTMVNMRGGEGAVGIAVDIRIVKDLLTLHAWVHN